MESHDAEFREDTRECANCGHGDNAHRYGRCIGNRNLCVCQHFWLTPPDGDLHEDDMRAERDHDDPADDDPDED